MAKERCDICDRNFKNLEALEMHKKSKHPVAEKKKKVNTSKIRNWAILIAIAALVIWGIYALFGSLNQYNDFAQCLNDAGAKMYGAHWCPVCKQQLALFGNGQDNLNYIECALPNSRQQNQLCNEEGIQSYPTWEFADETRATGLQTIAQLSQKTGCMVN